MRQWLIDARKQKGMSQADMAKAIKVSTPSYWAYESGACILTPFRSVVEALGGELVKPLYGPLDGALGLAARTQVQGDDLAALLAHAGQTLDCAPD